MLRRKVTGSFVCLRCRLQLGGPALGRTFSATRAENHTATRQEPDNTGADAAHREVTPNQQGTQPAKVQPAATPVSEPRPSLIEALAAFDEASKTTIKAAEYQKEANIHIEEGGRGNGKVFAEETNGQETTDHGSKVRYLTYGAGDSAIFQSRGKVLKANNEELPIGILGSPGAAIVLRSRRRRKKDHSTQVKTEAGDGSGAPLTEALDNQPADSRPSETFVNIDELRPADPHTVTGRDFTALTKRLADGFTTGQLRSYIRKFQSTVEEAAREEVPQVPSLPWVLEQKPWMPVVSEHVEADKLQGHTSRPVAPKEKLAVRIMRQCWHLASESAAELPGRLEVKLRETEFGLLLLGTQKWLRDITEDLMAVGGHLKLLCESNTVLILAPRTDAEKVMAELITVLSKAKTASIDVGLLSSSEPISSIALEDIGRMTNTLVRYSSSRKRIKVAWIDLSPTPDGHEIPNDAVRRFLLSAFHPKPHVSSALEVFHKDFARDGRYVAKHSCGPQLPWQERRKRWARWVTSIGVQKPGFNKPVIPCAILPHPVQLRPGERRECSPSEETPVEDPFPPPCPNSGWSREIQTDTRAVFGHVVHSDKSAGSLFRRTEVDASLARTFIPVAPPFVALNFPAVHRREPYHTSLLLRFIPDPQNTPPSATSPPPLELRLEIADNHIKRIVSLRAVANSFIGDILLPSAPVDVRLLQDRYFELDGKDTERYVLAITEFLDLADLQPWNGKLATPPGVKGLRLPARIVAPNSGNNVDASEDEVSIDYLFSSAEVQRTIATGYNGFKLAYKTIEAGQRGGKTAEVTLDPTVLGSHGPIGETIQGGSSLAPDQQPQDAEAFMKAVSKLAFHVVGKKSNFGWEVRQE